jgi:orotate phosphoribosyltransferase
MAPRIGHFRFESGHHGSRWLEPDRLMLRPAALRPHAIALSTRLRSHGVQAICGPLTGGAFVAQMVAEDCGVEFAFADRLKPQPPSDALYGVRYRVPDLFREVLRGKTVAIVNDVTNAGSAVCGTYEDLLVCGATPVVIGSLLTLGSWSASFAAEHVLGMESLETLPNDLWDPAECPRCAAGELLEDRSE